MWDLEVVKTTSMVGFRKVILMISKLSIQMKSALGFRRVVPIISKFSRQRAMLGFRGTI